MKPAQRLVATVGRIALDALFATVRFERTGDRTFEAYLNTGRAAIFVLWHGRLLPLSFHHRKDGLATLISRSADGEVIARVAERWGYRVVRGSSSRGASSALREIVRVLRAGQSVAITPDGPRGPHRRMKPGPLEAARLADVPIIPVAAGTPSAWWFEGWDRFLVPRPFARVRLVYGAPMRAPRDAGSETLETRTHELERALDLVTAQADAP